MKLSKKLLLITILFLITTSCVLPTIAYDMLYPILSNFPGLAEEEPEKDGGEDGFGTVFQPSQGWDCSASDLRNYLGDEWVPYQTLNLNLYLIDETFSFDLDFRSESTYLVQRDPDYRPPPGATLVPEGEYKFEENYLGFGEVSKDGAIFTGSSKMEFVHKTYFPEPVQNEGKIAFRAVGHFVSEGNLEICLDVYEGGYQDAINDPYNHLAPNCRWPGYIFSCTPAP